MLVPAEQGPGNPIPEDDKLDLRSLLVTLRRRRGLILAVLGSVMVLAIIVTALQTPRYTAEAEVVMNTRPDNVAPVQAGAAVSSVPTSSLADTEVEVMRSRDLALAVSSALNLDKDPKFNPLLHPQSSRIRRIGEAIGLMSPLPRVVATPEKVRQLIINQLQSSLTVTRVGETFAFTMAINTADPSESQRIANEYARQYTSLYLNTKRSSNAEAIAFLSKRLGELRDQAQADTAKVQQYRIANNLLSTSGASLTEQEISNYNQGVATARAQSVEDTARLSTAKAQLRAGSAGDDVGEALNSSVVGGLRAQRAVVSARLASLQARYGPLYPDVGKAKSELADVDAAIAAEIHRVITNLEAKSNVSRDRLSSLEGTLGGARGQLASNNRAMVGLDDLQRRAEASQQLYDSYLARYKQQGAEEGTEHPEARVTSYADLPQVPTSPKVALNLILALVIGAGLGLVAAFVAELTFSGLTTSLDVESRLNLRCLGSIPLLKSVIPRSGAPINAVLEHQSSSFAESFRSLRASIGYSVQARPPVILMTSALAREGKTTTSTCLARLCAVNGEKVVLVDVDVRQNGVSRLIRGKGGRPGLIQVLRGEATLDDALILDEASGAYILPIFQGSGETGNILIGGEMDALLEQLRERFNLIILDSPPVLPIADTRSLALKVDAIVMIARWRSTPDHAVRAALRMLPYDRVPIAGLILTQVDIKKQARFGYGDGAYYYENYKNYYS